MSDLPAPTEEQQSCIDFIRHEDGNLLINALAGTGKTTTLDFIQASAPTLPVLCLAFNKSVAEEASKRFPATTTVRTFNSLGHRIWAKSVSKVTFSPKKTQDLLKAVLSSLKGDDRKAASDAYWEIIGGVSTAKALGYIPDGKFPQARRLISQESFHAALDEKPSVLTASIIDSILLGSIRAAYEGSIDYNDQIFMPALFGGSFPRFPLVLVDEVQDLNPTNHAMLDKLVKNRIAAVGDPWQSIYGFRGALQGGMQQLRSRFSAEEKTISLSFRCPQAVVEAARWRVPNFRWIKEGGLVQVLQSLSAHDIPEGAAIICRNNAPLFRLAFGLLQSQRSVQVAGSDIGPRLIRIISKLGDHDTSRARLVGLIKEWKAAKLEASQAPKTICDMAACMEVFASFGESLGQAVAYAEHLFKQQGSIKLMTGHKAKGLEFDVVYHLDPWLIGDSEQEQNLRYVITTRSARELYEINSTAITWS